GNTSGSRAARPVRVHHQRLLRRGACPRLDVALGRSPGALELATARLVSAGAESGAGSGVWQTRRRGLFGPVAAHIVGGILESPACRPPWLGGLALGPGSCR